MASKYPVTSTPKSTGQRHRSPTFEVDSPYESTNKANYPYSDSPYPNRQDESSGSSCGCPDRSTPSRSSPNSRTLINDSGSVNSGEYNRPGAQSSKKSTLKPVDLFGAKGAGQPPPARGPNKKERGIDYLGREEAMTRF